MQSLRLLLVLLGLVAISSHSHADIPKLKWNETALSRETLNEINAATVSRTARSLKKFSTLRALLTPSGPVRVRFSRLKNRDWPAFIETAAGNLIEDSRPLYLLSGKLSHVKRGPRSGRLSEVKAAGSVVVLPGGKKKLTITFMLPGLFGARMYQVESDLASARAKVRSAPLRAIKSKTCGVEALINAAAAARETIRSSTSAPQVAPLLVKEIELATDCDYECYSELGLNANGTIATYVNTINSIYESQLGLTLRIVRQVTRSTTATYPPTVTNAEDLLPLFQTIAPQLGSADAKHLITGRNLDGSVVGLGYSSCYDIAGVVCLCPEYAAALTETQSDLFTPIIMAHEIGHNLGGSHVASGIMAATLNYGNPPQAFSADSISQITGFVASQGSCLSSTNVASSSSSSAGNSSSSASSSSSAGSSSSSSSATPPGSSSSSSSVPSSSSSSVPGAGGGGDNPPAFVPKAPIAVQYRRNTFSATVPVPAETAACQVSLLGSTRQADVFTRPYSIAGSQGTGSVIFSAVQVPYVAPRSKAVRAYIGATLSCGSTVYRTAVKRITVSNSSPTRAKRLASAGSWLKALKKKVKVS